MRNVAFILTVLVIPNLVFAQAQGSITDWAQLMSVLETTAYAGMGLIATAIVAVYMFGIVQNFNALGSGEASAMKNFYFWGLLVVFMSVSFIGIVAIIQNTVLPSSSVTGDPTNVRLVPDCLRFGGKGSNC